MQVQTIFEPTEPSGGPHPLLRAVPSDASPPVSVPPLGPLMLSVKEVTRLLGIGRTTLWAMVHSGELGAVKHGGRVLFPAALVDEYVAAQTERAREQAERRRSARVRRPWRRH